MVGGKQGEEHDNSHFQLRWKPSRDHYQGHQVLRQGTLRMREAQELYCDSKRNKE